MATYLVTMAVGKFELNPYRAAGVAYLDAIGTKLFDPVAAPRSGTQFAISQIGDLSYKRLTRTISVPAAGAQVSFWVTRYTEPGWDFLFVEAHTVGRDDWTTLPDVNGHTRQDTGFSCPFWLTLHPFLAHYQTHVSDDGCRANGTTGDWWAASGASDGPEQWSSDLSAWVGRDVEVSITYASDDIIQHDGVFIDDIVVSTGAGTTSFENDGDVTDGWHVPGAPAGSAANPNDWVVGTVADTPPSTGMRVRRAFARQPEIVSFLSNLFGSYPFTAAGGIVHDTDLISCPDALFDFAVYTRGAMTLHRLRLTVGDEAFFRILRRWAQSRAGDNVTTGEFVRLAERISGQELSPLFDEWLFTTGKPVLDSAGALRPAPAGSRRQALRDRIVR